MFDLIIALLVMGSAVRGYTRGVVRESVEFLALLISVPLGFRVGGSLGERLFPSMAPVFASLLGAAIFLTFSGALAGWVGYRIVGKGYAPEPAERAPAATVGFLRGIVMAVILAVAASATIPGSAPARWAAESAFVRVVTVTDGPVLGLLSIAIGDEDLLTIVEFNRSFGGNPPTAGEDLPLPRVEEDRLEVDSSSAYQIFLMVNEARSEKGLPTLDWSESLASVGTAYALEMYTNGFFSHDSITTGDVGDRAESAGIRYTMLGENLALAPNPVVAHDGLMNSPGHRANILEPNFNQLGVGVVRGPLGLMVVQVFKR